MRVKKKAIKRIVRMFSKKQQIYILILLGLVVLLVPLIHQSYNKEEEIVSVIKLEKVFKEIDDENKKQVTLERVVDGDTAVFIMDGKSEKFRFLAIDTPEKNEFYGKESTSYTKKCLEEAKEIYVEFDTNADSKDKYGRSLAWIWFDGKILQEELVARGYAEIAYIYGDYKYLYGLIAQQRDVRLNEVGIWKGRSEEEWKVKH